MANPLTCARIHQWIEEEANFFRLHLLFFLLVPLIAGAIFYAVNGKYPVSFLDSLFLCYSALTVTGLSVVNLSTITVFQQVILFVLMICGDVTVIAWIMVLVRKRYFRQHVTEIHRRKTTLAKIGSRFAALLYGATGRKIPPAPHIHLQPDSQSTGGSFGRSAKPERIQAGEGIGAAIVGGAGTGLGLGIALGGRHVNADSGAIKDLNNGEAHDSPSLRSRRSLSSHIHIAVESSARLSPSTDFTMNIDGDEHGVITDVHSFTSSPRSGASPLPISPTTARTPYSPFFQNPEEMAPRRRRPGVPVPRRQTMIVPPKYSEGEHAPLGQRRKDRGLGGFPGPLQRGRKLARYLFPRAYRRLGRTFTIMPPAERTKRQKSMKWLSENLRDLVIGRNSDFNTEYLSDEQLEELGGLEYRALRLLSYLVILYFIGTQMITFILIAPWLSTSSEYDDVFASQPRLVNKSWFVAFQIVGAYTGGGMSLVDAGMVPFQKAYLMIFSLIFCILAGNHGLPIFLRLIIWVCTKLVKDGSTRDQVLHFLLDHPRRCFLYLFPSHVTWFLVLTLVFFTAIEWSSFIVLDIGLSVTESLPAGTRAVAGLFQSFAVRASGFSIVSISSLAPSFQFLCVIMMYIAVYPVAMSIRSTNVYEEKSLGVFEVAPEDEDEEPNLDEKQPRRERIGKYFGWHLRRQVAFDIWWLVCAIFLICIIERTKIMDDDNAPWFNLFRIVFELVSAFGGIGLSLGIPTKNYSFSGAFGPLSKLVVMVVMVRGRHRGLPVAIDRAILLPGDLVPNRDAGQGQRDDAQPINPDDNMAEKGEAPQTTPQL